MKQRHEYPELEEVGCPVKTSKHRYRYVRGIDLAKAMRRRGLDYAKFGEQFGVQTCPAEGMYAWDVEAALRRMRTGEKESLLTWD